jgi:hypothetical protein
VVSNRTNAAGRACGGCPDVLSAAYAHFFSTSMPLKTLYWGIVSGMLGTFIMRREGYSLVQTFEAVGSQKLLKG